VQVPCDEGVAIHIGPESCAAVREGRGEALTGECTSSAGRLSHQSCTILGYKCGVQDRESRSLMELSGATLSEGLTDPI
jgi:hypothetical protein